RKIWGELSDSEAAHAVYFVHWTVGAPEHYPNIDLVIGPWGSSSTPNDRILVSLIYRPASGGGSFMVIDGDGRPADDRGLCARAMKRGEVVGTPFATEVFSLVDALWLTEPRID